MAAVDHPDTPLAALDALQRARTPADHAVAALDLLAAHAAAAGWGSADLYRETYGPKVNHYPGPWPEQE